MESQENYMIVVFNPRVARYSAYGIGLPT